MDCTGQRPSSSIISELSPASISPSGHLRVKPTLQLADEKLHNVYACGDVADTKTPNPNARSAMRQASVVAENILSIATGGKARHEYENNWSDGVIKLTLGLVRLPCLPSTREKRANNRSRQNPLHITVMESRNYCFREKKRTRH